VRKYKLISSLSSQQRRTTLINDGRNNNSTIFNDISLEIQSWNIGDIDWDDRHKTKWHCRTPAQTNSTNYRITDQTEKTETEPTAHVYDILIIHLRCKST